MIGRLLMRGMLVGLVAGILAFGVAMLFGEPQVQHAIDFESQVAAQHHEPAEVELVARDLQGTVGLLTGTVVFGVALGGIFSLVFAWAYGRVGAMGARATAAMLAAAAFLTVTLIPFTKYPGNPPGVGNPQTIDRRTILFGVMIAISILAAIAAARLRRQLVGRLGSWTAAIIAVGAYLAVIAGAELALPALHEVPDGFPADVLYRFRLASLAISLMLWTTIGVAFGAVAERVLERRLSVNEPAAEAAGAR